MMSRLLPVVGILIAVGLFLGYINPTYTGPVAEARAKIKSYDTALQAAEDFTEKENTLRADKNAIPEEQLERLESMLPDGVDNVQLILDLDALANRTGVTLSGFDVEKVTERAESTLTGADQLFGEKPSDSLTLTVTAAGTYGAFRAFLEGVEHSLRLLDLVGLQITDSATGVYTYTMTFHIYWLR